MHAFLTVNLSEVRWAYISWVTILRTRGHHYFIFAMYTVPHVFVRNSHLKNQKRPSLAWFYVTFDIQPT